MSPRTSLVALVPLLFIATPSHAAPCALDTPAACFERGFELAESGSSEAIAWLESACESKAALGCVELGFQYIEGKLVERDTAKGFALSKRGCDLGSGQGCFNAAVYTRDGLGTARDDKAMKALAERACKLDHGAGCYLVGAIFGEGLGVEPDHKRSNVWLDKACRLDHDEACYVMGSRYRLGAHGVPKDAKRATQRLAKACELGQAEACDLLGAVIADGAPGYPTGGIAAAHPYFVRGCELGNELACSNQKLSAEALDEDTKPASRGSTALTLTSRVGQKVTARLSGGAPLAVGVEGEITKHVKELGFSFDLVIGTVRVTSVKSGVVTLLVLGDQSETVIDGKKVDHWKPGIALELKWKAR